MSAVKCGACKQYLQKEDATQLGIQFFHSDHLPQPKRTERKPIKQMSKKRQSEIPERNKVREQVYTRANGMCEYAKIIPEVKCDGSMEVDEIHGGKMRAVEYLDAAKCILTCQIHHRIKTDNKLEIIGRLNGEPHGQIRY